MFSIQSRCHPLLVGLLLGVLCLCVSALAQESNPIDVAVKRSLISLVIDLQNKLDQQLAGNQAAFHPQGPINPALKALGRPIDTSLSSSVPAQGLLNFKARVVHEHGSSDWTLSVLDDGQIVAYSYSISALPEQTPITPSVNAHARVTPGPASNDAEILGGFASVFRRSLDFARPPSATNQPGSEPATQPPSRPTVDPRVVDFLVASTRKQIEQPSTENASYSGERAPLTYGAASVRIPDDHKIGRIELPSSWKLFGINLWSTSPDEHKHFIIKRVVSLSEDEFDRVIKTKSAHTALIFIHGFNTTFEDGLYRNAQIVWDLQYQGLSILFTWASRGEITDYIYDKDSAYLARQSFISLLEKLKRDYAIEQVNVLAHSMGNVIAVDRLANYAKTSNPVQIAHLLMAAPDIDRDQFVALVPEAKAIVGGMTLYASSADRAMMASWALAGGVPRAGDVPPEGPVVLPDLETIDVSAVGDDILGLNHNVFAASRDVVEDISALLQQNKPSPRLAQIHAAPEPPAPPQYWRYVP